MNKEALNIFVSGLPEAITYNELRRTFHTPLQQCQVRDYHITRFHNKGQAVITILGLDLANRFLQTFGTPRNGRPKLPLRCGRKQLNITKSTKEPSEFDLKALVHEQNQRSRKPPVPTPAAAQPASTNEFALNAVLCGNWDYAKEVGPRSDPKLVFIHHWAEYTTGRAIFGRNEAKIILGDGTSIRHRIDIPYRDCRNITIGAANEPTVTFTLYVAPKMYELDLHQHGDERSLLLAQMSALGVGNGPTRQNPQQANKKHRVSEINASHRHVVGHCFVYRVSLLDRTKLATIRSIVSRSDKCTVMNVKTNVEYPQELMDKAFVRLNYHLSDQARYGNRPFQLLFQVDRLARNGYLPPDKVVGLLDQISRLHLAHGLDQTVAGLRRFARELTRPSPDDDKENISSNLSIGALEEKLEEFVACYDSSAPDNPYELAKRYNHINLIHKVIVTPSSIRLEGPEPEPTNRVLRRHSENTDLFVRVLFQDEDGGRVSYDWSSNYERIYHQRFKGILDSSITIAGKSFTFLGFSHSSLRSQSCWFMAPFVKYGTLMFAEMVIKELGDFSNIRIAAKCAARIGQNFTDTNTSVRLTQDQVFALPMIVRNGRDFADGAGTISMELLREVWRVYGTKRMLKPTALQIRFQGAKGMVALDTRLPGKRLMLRDNMTKYLTQTVWDFEICGAAFRPLPMILNRQFIKILEDLGVPYQAFADLQDTAMKHLRMMTQSAVNTGHFLDEVSHSRASGLSTLIRYLGQIGLDYHFDHFLYSAVELAVIAELRDLKHRGRIPVEEGVTLYGLPDETGYLKEGEILVITEKAPEGGKKVLVKNNVAVTRSPALHPGDIQLVNAVDVPENSPLRQLSNVVVFSKWGARDLPSMLSGGDLDGDLYNVIWHDPLIPRTTYQPADYPRLSPIALSREVTRKDMSDFFVTFMENDKLGMISLQHLQLADQMPMGTLDPGCVKLAALASTAVDYSKTGIPADMQNAPRPAKFKPDFMAPNPRVVISHEGLLDLQDEDNEPDEAFDSIDSERRPMRYYESQKALGQLYRRIDERQFLADMQRDYRSITTFRPRQDLMPQLLRYVVHTATVTYGGNLYSHYKDLARQIRNSFEESLATLMIDCEPTPHKPLSETEVFAGEILGRHNGPDGKALRELSEAMRERFKHIVDYCNLRITHGDDQMEEVEDLDDLYGEEYSEREIEALPRAIACLEVAVKEIGYEDRTAGRLQSFKYIAAAAALRELDRYRVTTLGSYTGLPRAL
ncbi:Putative RNA-dependent RNA polymerase, eukaryotic-type [Septoria linicola]|uniref:RNA-dependent RNA polymerase n=1 Tax=Septoria linicola TaxID=215465 RepID=A0A9Q9B787_9PEZI|nr:Putative RNA-dependent RNA polymerase, eukaryotic-type [Septoria linicola]